MQCRRPIAFLLWAFLFVWLAGAVSVSAESMTLRFEVQSGFMVEVPDELVFPALAPGDSTEQSVEVTVWSNTEWDLAVGGGDLALFDGTETVSVETHFEVRDFVGNYQVLSGSNHDIAQAQEPTDADGTTITVDFRLEGAFGDPPGEYTTDVIFTVVPQL